MRGAPAKELSDTKLVRVLKALSHPERFRMVQEIAAAGELSCSQVAEKFNLSQPTISHHLKLLADAGILTTRTHGKHHFFCVDRGLLALLSSLLATRLSPAKLAKHRTSALRRPRPQLPSD
jgi:ArsR family transcriptional regulator